MAALPLFPDDPVDAIMRVMARAFQPQFGEAWNRRQVADAMVLGNCRYGLITGDGTVCQDDNPEVAGFFLARQAYEDEELLLFAIDPAHRRRGLGGRLLDHFCTSAPALGVRTIFLEMRAGNPAARLYESRGFQNVGTRPAYYRSPDGTRLDALTFRRIVAPA